MTKSYISLGLMSGTSGDGVDASLIKSTGSLNKNNSYEVILDKYFEYDQVIFNKIYVLRNKINTIKDLKIHSNEIEEVERLITIFHAKVADTAGVEIINIEYEKKDPFFNINTKEDLKKAYKMLEND